jgi:hypothetical protein
LVENAGKSGTETLSRKLIAQKLFLIPRLNIIEKWSNFIFLFQLAKEKKKKTNFAKGSKKKPECFYNYLNCKCSKKKKNASDTENVAHQCNA